MKITTRLGKQIRNELDSYPKNPIFGFWNFAMELGKILFQLRDTQYVPRFFLIRFPIHSVHFISNVVIWQLVSELWFSIVVDYFGCFDSITSMVAYFHYRKNKFCFRGLLFSHFPFFFNQSWLLQLLRTSKVVAYFFKIFPENTSQLLIFSQRFSSLKKVAYRGCL